MVKDKKIRPMGVKEGQPPRAGTGGGGWAGLEPRCPVKVASAFWFVFTLEGEGTFPLHIFLWKVQSSEVKFSETPGTGNYTTLTVLSGYF